jgi:putative salt-induced outer membrane protein YdiY
VTRGRITRQGFVVLAVAAMALGATSVGFSQEVPLKDSPPKAKDSSDVTNEGVPEEAVEAEEGVTEVEQAMEQVEAEIEQGLPEEFTIKFGDVYDWMRLTSGEWLKGRLKRMRDDRVEFDSDKLDIVEFDWDKVDQLHCPQVNTYVFEDKLDVVGRAVVTKKTVLVETGEGVESYPRVELLSIVDGEPRERNWWSTKLALGFSANAGNTNQGSLTTSFLLQRADYRTRAQLRYDGTIGYANKEQNVNRHIGNAEVRLFLSHLWYFTPAAAQFLNDRFQNIKLRATPGAGAGVHVFDTKKWEWDLKAGLGYQYIEFLSAAAGVDNPQNDGFISLGTWAELEFVEDVELELEWQTNLVYTNIGNTNHTGRAEFSVEINDIFDFETSFLFLRTENPVPRADGTVPASNDYQLIVSVALEID